MPSFGDRLNLALAAMSTNSARHITQKFQEPGTTFNKSATTSTTLQNGHPLAQATCKSSVYTKHESQPIESQAYLNLQVNGTISSVSFHRCPSGMLLVGYKYKSPALMVTFLIGKLEWEE